MVVLGTELHARVSLQNCGAVSPQLFTPIHSFPFRCTLVQHWLPVEPGFEPLNSEQQCLPPSRSGRVSAPSAVQSEAAEAGVLEITQSELGGGATRVPAPPLSNHSEGVCTAQSQVTRDCAAFAGPGWDAERRVRW